MYLILWKETNLNSLRRGVPESFGTPKWERCATHQEAVVIIKENGLENDPDAIVIPPNGTDEALTASQLILGEYD